jgi:threonine/homoserine/homoserine lactone efflux protein
MAIDFPAFVLAATALAITPGPSILYVAAFSLRYGTKAGIISALGVNAGSYVLIMFAAFGLYPVLQIAPGIVTAIQTLGGVYMIYLAYNLWPKKTAATAAFPDQVFEGNWKNFTRGLTTTLLNPKDILFYILFIPSFIAIDEGKSGFLIWFLVLAVAYAVIGLATKSLIAVFAGQMQGFLVSRDASVVHNVSFHYFGTTWPVPFVQGICWKLWRRLIESLHW